MSAPSNHPSILQALAVAAQLQQSGQAQQAGSLYMQILASAPGNEQAALQLARIYHQHQQDTQARNVLESAVKNGASNFNLFYMLAALQHVATAYDLAEANIRQAIQLQPESAEAHNILGSILIERNQHDLAISAFKKSIKYKPDSPDAHNNLAWLYRALGEKKNAIRHFETAVSIDATATEALSGLVLLKTYQHREPEFDLIEALLKQTRLNPKQRSELEFALGKAYEDIQDYSRAFKHFKHGNSAWRKTFNYSIEQDMSLFRSIKQAFPEACLEPALAPDIPLDVAPIFILGMPRSSTSLIEQVLASHSQVNGAGELTQLEVLCLPDQRNFSWSNNPKTKLAKRYLENLALHAKNAAFVTDKMPQNFRLIGPILELFPHARIIHCRRSPYDTCLSLYKHHFPMASHPYCYDLKELGQYYLLYEDLMAHWHQIAPGKIYDIQYEKLVENFEPEVQKILDYCGLEFEQGCLDFFKTKRVVRTASSDQVRQSLYSNAAGRWKHYQQQLQPLIDVIGPRSDS